MSIRRGRLNRRTLGARGGQQLAPFNGLFTSIFTGAFQVVQSDLGLTYGGTPLATTGNTSTTVITLTGTLATVPVPILVKSTNTLAIDAGAQFSIFYDGGTTPAMTGVTPSAGVPVPLTGAASGLSLAWAAGTSVTNDTWNATCSGWADQSGNAKDYSQATASKQPIITVGVNGKPGLRGDGVDDSLVSLLNLVAPATTPYTIAIVGKLITHLNPRRLVGATTEAQPTLRLDAPSPNIAQAGSALGNATSGMVLGSFGALTSFWSGSASDYMRGGTAAAVTGANSGGGASTGRQIFTSQGANASNFEILMAAYIPGLISEAAFRAAVTTFYGGTVLA